MFAVDNALKIISPIAHHFSWWFHEFISSDTHTHTINSLFDALETETERLDFWTQNRNVNNKSVIVFLCCQFVARSGWSCVGPLFFSYCSCISPKWKQQDKNHLGGFVLILVRSLSFEHNGWIWFSWKCRCCFNFSNYFCHSKSRTYLLALQMSGTTASTTEKKQITQIICWNRLKTIGFN